jgi:hypothetical protein
MEIGSKEKPIQGLKIKYDNETYDSITYFSISNWDGKESVSFTNKKNENTVVNVHCKFSDIEIIGKMKSE